MAEENVYRTPAYRIDHRYQFERPTDPRVEFDEVWIVALKGAHFRRNTDGRMMVYAPRQMQAYSLHTAMSLGWVRLDE